MFRCWLAFVFLFPLAHGLFAQIFDTTRPPTPADREKMIELGWEHAAAEIAASMAKNYQPGRMGNLGSAGKPPFVAWLDCWEWCTLMASSEWDHIMQLAAWNFGFDPENGQWLLRRPGQPLISRAYTPSTDRLQTYLSTPENVQTMFDILIGKGYHMRGGNLADRTGEKLATEMLLDEKMLRTFLGALEEYDFAPTALARLRELYETNSDAFREYFSLAVALALVWDQAPPPSWPHNQVDQRKVPLDQSSVPERFVFWREANSGGRLYNDLRNMPPEELKFLVDAPLAFSEFEWAQKETRFPKASFERAFSSIKYDLPRLNQQLYDWPHESYTLAEIKKHGGICVDQAYFAMISGKARGLPTLFFVGQGSDGGHAWFGYLKGPGRWELDCGRYENQNYAVGQAIDPQSWMPISDHELKFLAASFRKTPRYQASYNDLRAARMFAFLDNKELENLALQSAIATEPNNLEAWMATANRLEADNAPIEERRAHLEKAVQQFYKYDDIRVAFQQELANLARQEGNIQNATDYEERIIRQNRRGRSDLSVNIAANNLFRLVEEKKWDDAVSEYRSLLNRLGRSGGGNFFYEITYPFFHSLLEAGDTRNAKRVLDLTRRVLNPSPNSVLDHELNSLTLQIP